MDINSYQNQALYTMRTDSKQSTQERYCNVALGLTGESGEFADSIKKWAFHGHGLDIEANIKELGDILWYVSAGAMLCGVTLEEVAERNLEKLKARYPNGFPSEDSILRTDEEAPGFYNEADYDNRFLAVG